MHSFAQPSRIVLYGRLRKKFGPEFTLSVPTPSHAVYALMRTQDGFRDELAKGQYRIVRGPRKGGLDLDERLLGIELVGLDLHIIPVAKGRGRSTGGIVKTVIGVALLALSVVTANPELALFGAGLIFSGIGSILTHYPKPVNPRASFLLSGPLNTTAQGGPVPLPYGMLVRVGSVVISSGYDAAQLTNFNNGGVDETNMGGSAIDQLGQFLASKTTGSTNAAGTGSVNAVSISQPGQGYTTASVVFAPTSTDGGGSGAAATCVITSGSVTEIVLQSGGSDYGAAPSVTITGDGSGATAVATVTTTT